MGKRHAFVAPDGLLVMLVLCTCVYGVWSQDAYMSTQDGNIYITAAPGMGVYVNGIDVNNAIENLTAQFSAYVTSQDASNSQVHVILTIQGNMIQQLQSTVAAQQTVIQKLNTSILALQDTTTTQGNNIQSLQTQDNTNQMNTMAQGSAISVLQMQLASTQSTVSGQGTSLTALQTQIASNQASVAQEIASQNATIVQQGTSLTQQLASINSINAMVVLQGNNIASLNATSLRLTANINTANSTIIQQVSSITQQASTITQLGSNITTINATLGQYGSTIGSINSTVSTLQSFGIASLNTTIGQNTATISSLNTTVNSLNASITQQAATIVQQGAFIATINRTILVPMFTSSPGLLITAPDVPPGGIYAPLVTINAISLANAITYVLTNGSLPAGLSLSSTTGQISGVPTKVTKNTTSTFQVVAMSPVFGTNATSTFSIIINPTPVISTTAYLLASVPDVGPNTGGSYTLLASINAAIVDSSSLVFAVVNGSLPAGISLNSANGQLSGTPTKLTVNTTSIFNVTVTSSLYGTVATGSYSIFMYITRDGTTTARASTPFVLRSLGITTNGYYYINANGIGGQTTTIYALVSFNFLDSKDWVLMMQLSQPATSTGIVQGTDWIGSNAPWLGFCLQHNSNFYYSYYGSYQRYTAGAYGTGTSGGNYGGYQVFLGTAGGHGWYNSAQGPCSWGNAAGSVGAGWDGSTCGTYPTALRMGYGNSGNANYGLGTGLFSSWIYMGAAY